MQRWWRGGRARGLLNTALLLLACAASPAPHRAAAYAAAVPACEQAFAAGEVAMAAPACAWQQTAPPAGAASVAVEGARSLGFFPLLHVADSRAAPSPAAAGYELSLRRLSVVGARLARSGSGMPVLFPQGLFDVAPTNLSMMDVRLVVSDEDFKACLAFFAGHLRSIRTADDNGIGMHTDGVGFLNIPWFSDGATQVHSCTVISGPCRLERVPAPLDYSRMTQLMAGLNGCNVRSVDNRTLVPTLLRDAGVQTTAPLLVRITTNVTLGPGLNGSIPIRRPVLLMGLASSVMSVDFGMVVNQLNVTTPGAQLAWQSLIMENLAPGDTTSSVIAPPYSTATSTNLWPVYCNRSAALCVPLINVTVVIPTEREVNYHLLMYTMYTSPAPSLRALAAFMNTDLGFKALEFKAGPGNDSMTIIHLLSKSWHFWNVVTTPHPIVAPQLPTPERPFTLAKSGPAPLMQAVSDCNTLQSAVAATSSSRVYIWRLTANLSVASGGRMSCSWPSGNITAPTYIFGDVSGSTDSLQPLPSLLQQGAGAAASRDAPPLGRLFELDFGHAAGVFQLPSDARDKFVQVQNVTLSSLPQGVGTEEEQQQGSGRRRLLLLQLRDGVQQWRRHGRLLLQTDKQTSPFVWTLLLWPFRRGMGGASLFVENSQLMIPLPEWQLLAHAAAAADSFAFQLQGAGGLTFSDTSVAAGNKAIRVGAFQGPGVSGSNLWLLPDPAGVPQGYSWPAGLDTGQTSLDSSTSTSSGSSSSTGGSKTAVAVGAAVGAAVFMLLVAAAAGLLLRRKQRRSQEQRLLLKQQQQQHDADRGGKPGWHTGRKQPAAVPGCGVAAGALAAGAAAAGGSGKPGHGLDTISSCDASLASKSKRGAGSLPSGSCTASRSISTSLSSMDAAPGRDTARGGASSSQLELSIAQGMEHFQQAVSQTTMALMQRRLGYTAAQASSGSSRSSGSGSRRLGSTHMPRRQDAAGAGQLQQQDGPGSGGGGSGLELHQLLGSGSFASVYLGTWRGKQVAVKVMHLPANALNSPVTPAQRRRSSAGGGSQQPAEGTGSRDEAAEDQRLQHQQTLNSPPHMAVMEAVVSSTMSHPNLVQVYTYVLHPLMARPAGGITGCGLRGSGSAGAAAAALMAAAVAQAGSRSGSVRGGAAADAADSEGTMSGWNLQLVMEYAAHGTLRESLDQRRLPRVADSTFVQPAVVLSLAHDIACACMHLHSEGIVHGDLKAANVLLTAGSIDTSSGNGGTGDAAARLEVWASAGCLPLSAKVSDFGLATTLGPQDTHATMLARGTPTHMSPELFMQGRVSKASDVFAFGILLNEIVTGRRAYAGVPVPLLPHQVAVAGLRPEWPPGLPPACGWLQQLAEACWAQQPQDRPTFAAILKALVAGDAAPAAAAASTSTTTSSSSQQQPPRVPAGAAPAAGAGGLGEAPLSPQPAAAPCEQQQQLPAGAAYGGGRKHVSWSEVSCGVQGGGPTAPRE